jgi:hypothetical protein
MRVHFVVLLGAVLVGAPVLAQTTPVPTAADQAASVALVQKAVVRALNFDRGDGERLRGAREEFTPEGWRAFMKHLDGWLDEKGAPTFSSSFVPSGGHTIVSQSEGALHVTIPGTLKHRQDTSSTTYRIVVEVQARGKPLKIESLKQSICGGATATPCQ